MSANQWENLPEPRPERPITPFAASWQGFSADPRPPANQALRASDADRDYATRLIEQARLDGRLTPAEQAERANVVAGSRTLGELAPLVGDLMPADPAVSSSELARVHARNVALRSWIGLAVLLNVIWVMTSLTAGQLLYYWPMWPMAGVGVPLFFAFAAGGRRSARRSQPPRQLPPRQLPPNDLR